MVKMNGSVDLNETYVICVQKNLFSLASLLQRIVSCLNVIIRLFYSSVTFDQKQC